MSIHHFMSGVTQFCLFIYTCFYFSHLQLFAYDSFISNYLLCKGVIFCVSFLFREDIR